MIRTHTDAQAAMCYEAFLNRAVQDPPASPGFKTWREDKEGREA